MPATEPHQLSQLNELQTPCLLLDERKMARNIDRLSARARALGVSLRPHLKTVKSVDAARKILAGVDARATVSTLAEAEAFAAAGVRDILYAVGIAPHKLDRVISLRRKGCDLSVILDTVEQARAVAQAARQSGVTIPALIEIDCDGHRSGLRPDDPVVLEIGRVLHGGPGELRGVMTHAGESYNARGREAQAAFADQERDAVLEAAGRLRSSGLSCQVVSVGSTPTAHAARDLTGVTELRAGVYVFFDLVMAGIDVCTVDDIALSVLTTVIGHQPEKGWIIVDGGWMAMSRDRGTQNQAVDQGYGLVCAPDGTPYPDLIMVAANQEHGVIATRPGSDAQLPDLPIGALLRVLPNHACSTGAQFDAYTVLPDDGGPLKIWPRFRGW